MAPYKAASHPGTLTGMSHAPVAAPKPSMGNIRTKVLRPPIGSLQEFILDSLAYKSMRDREEEVADAHSQTFEWIFASVGAPSTAETGFGNRFTAWLATDGAGPIYWISGKPGSGKSTLMRFLFEHEATMRYLKEWTGERPITKAGFFFWTSGSREQRSQTGLLRYLLHQLLSANREFVSMTFPDLWQKLLVITTKERIQLSINWTASELMAAFNNFLSTALRRMSLLLFVDGLDEFDGDHKGIVSFFKSLGEGPHGNHVKICLSSRPWDVFEDAFQHSIPNLRLQDLTNADMITYTQDRLREGIRKRRLRIFDEGAFEELVQKAVKSADGVFLWVRLAVSKMLDEFYPSKGLDNLQAVLETLPTELDELFEKLLFKDQNATQIAETASLFQLINAREVVADFLKDESATSLIVWELAFALDADESDQALTLPVEQITDAALVQRCKATSTYVQERFAGLLDLFAGRSARERNRRRNPVPEDSAVLAAHSLAQSKVTYIHRTVRDWLMGTGAATGARTRLEGHSPSHFDAHLRLLRSYVLRLKLPLQQPERHRRLDEWWPDIALAMTHARLVRRDPVGLLRPLLNAMDAAVGCYWLPRAWNEGDHWARNAFGSYEVRMMAPRIREPFLCLAVKFGVVVYVKEELEARKEGSGDGEGRGEDDGNEGENEKEEEEEEEDKSTPLLAYATEFLCSQKQTLYPVSNPELVEYLLSHPSSANPDPNHSYVHFITRAPTTPWITLLRHLRDARRRGWIEYYDTNPERTARWATIVRMFVELGQADVNAVVVADRWDPEVSALGVLELLEETYGNMEMHELREMVASRIRSEGGSLGNARPGAQ